MKPREPVMSEHARKVLAWRESFLKLEENRFFEIMRMYLGEIKTPYNKQNLILNLEGFFRRKENLINIKSLLSEKEIEIICAIVFIPDSTEKKITSFFENTFTYSFIYETLLNLEERLIIFRQKRAIDNSDCYVIELNPFLEDALFDLIKVEKLLKDVEYEKGLFQDEYILPELITCFLLYILENPSLAKQDGSLKKHTMEDAEKYFGKSTKMLPLLYSAFLNLAIVKEKNKGVEIDWSKLKSFTSMSFLEQLIYLIVSSCGHFSRENLFRQAQIFLDTFLYLKQKVFSKELFYKTCYLAAVQKNVETNTNHSRFSKILTEGRSRLLNESNDKFDNSAVNSIEGFFDACVNFGLFRIEGISNNEENVYCVNDFYKEQIVENPENKGMINISSGFEISLMPGFKIENTIELIKFLSLIKYDKVCLFSLSKKSMIKGFDLGLSNNEILNLLKSHSLYEIPEVLKIQIEEWWSSYSSASFYKGFVLKVDGKAAIAAENNVIFSRHIHTIIAPGVYLLDVDSDEQAMNLIKESGLDFIGKIKSVVKENSSLDFIKLNLQGNEIRKDSGFETPSIIIDSIDSSIIEKQMKDALDQISLDEQQRESLELRIERKVIVNSQQLNAGILRVEKIHAKAMDFAGKVYVFEQALKNNENIEIGFEKNEKVVFGKPIGIRKSIDDTFCQIQLAADGKVREFSLGKAFLVKRIRNSIYQD